MAETCAKRQPVPLKNDNPRIQDQDYWAIILNARRLTAFWPTLLTHHPINSGVVKLDIAVTRALRYNESWAHYCWHKK